MGSQLGLLGELRTIVILVHASTFVFMKLVHKFNANTIHCYVICDLSNPVSTCTVLRLPGYYLGGEVFNFIGVSQYLIIKIFLLSLRKCFKITDEDAFYN